MSKYIFIAGGVMSGVGKGTTSAAIGRILQSKGFRITAIKIDPYVNVDAGTMNPVEHGEVFVTEDGDETDQDLGNYERFLDLNILSKNYMTTGRVYQSVIERERNLEYGGKCVEVVPHVPEEVIRRIEKAAAENEAEITLIEIGGTVGEYQNILFLEAARMLRLRHPKDVIFVMVSYLPIPNKVGEMKTKPTQYAVRSANAVGIQPDILIGRSEVPMDDPRKEKLAVSCSILVEDIISGPDCSSIYEVPLNFEKEKLSARILGKLGLEAKKDDMSEWVAFVDKIRSLEDEVKIGIVGKYFTTGNFVLSDAYISVIESLKHAAWSHGKKPKLFWLNSEEYEKNPEKLKELSELDGVLIPGGFGSRGVEGKIAAVRYVRENKIPYLGLCYGMHMAVIEFARNVCGLADANTAEINPTSTNPVIHIMEDQARKLQHKKYGGTMRLGAYPCVLRDGSVCAHAYGAKEISERHRHRYEVNNAYRDMFEAKGLHISGTSPDGQLAEIVELDPAIHPFFVAVQFHPEFKSRPLRPHPLFQEFVRVALAKHRP